MILRFRRSDGDDDWNKGLERSKPPKELSLPFACEIKIGENGHWLPLGGETDGVGGGLEFRDPEPSSDERFADTIRSFDVSVEHENGVTVCDGFGTLTGEHSSAG